jgi:hypothetical protein
LFPRKNKSINQLVDLLIRLKREEEMVSPGNAALLLDYDQYINMDAINIPAQDPNFSAFSWPPLVQPHHHHQHQQQQQQQQQQTLNAFAHTATVSCPNFG